MDWKRQGNSSARDAAAGRPPTTPGTPGDSLPRKTWLIFIAVLLANYLLMRFLFPTGEEAITVPYTVFKAEAAKGNVTAIFSQGDRIEGRFAAPVTWPSANDRTASPRAGALPAPRSAQTFTTTLPQFVGPELE